MIIRNRDRSMAIFLPEVSDIRMVHGTGSQYSDTYITIDGQGFEVFPGGRGAQEMFDYLVEEWEKAKEGTIIKNGNRSMAVDLAKVSDIRMVTDTGSQYSGTSITINGQGFMYFPGGRGAQEMFDYLVKEWWEAKARKK